MYPLNPLYVEAYFEVLYKELLQEVERERLLRQASANKRQGSGLSQRMLVFLGAKLVSLGQHLQENYRPASEKVESSPSEKNGSDKELSMAQQDHNYGLAGRSLSIYAGFSGASTITLLRRAWQSAAAMEMGNTR